METISREQVLDIWKGKVLSNNTDIEKAFRAFDHDAEGERLFVIDKDGNILEITGGENSPIQPIVKFDEWVDFGKDSEKAVSRREGAPDFLARHPKVIDASEVVGDEGSK